MAVNGIVTETLVNLFTKSFYSYRIFSLASDCPIQAMTAEYDHCYMQRNEHETYLFIKQLQKEDATVLRIT
jgi:hypothetical protein